MTSVNDTTLITFERPDRPVRFVVVALIAFLILTAIWAASARKLAAVHFAPTRLTSSDANLGSLVKYAAADRKDVVWVGSSLTAALSERFFTIPHSYNLGLSGGSPVTALEIVERLPSLPKAVIVETNILDRTPDDSLLYRPWEQFDNLAVAIPANFYRPLHLVPAAIFYRPERIRLRAEARRKALLEEPSTYRGLQPGAREVLASLDRLPVRDERETSNAARLVAAKDRLLARGVRVFFVDIPFAPELRAHPYNVHARFKISGQSEYVCDVCIDLLHLLPADELGWNDGQHVNERTSILVIDAMEKILRSSGALGGDVSRQ
jgi:hypothetical protein